MPPSREVSRIVVMLMMGGSVAASGCAGADETDPDAGVMSDAEGEHCALPKCVADVFAMCTPSGACGTSVVEGGVEYCYENAVTIRSQPFSAGPALGAYSVNKPDGSACYSVELQATTEQLSYVYRAAGSSDLIVATNSMQGSMPGQPWEIKCGGAATVVFPADCKGDVLLLPPSKVSDCSTAMQCEEARCFGN
jgi:hypothetical protein